MINRFLGMAFAVACKTGVSTFHAAVRTCVEAFDLKNLKRWLSNVEIPSPTGRDAPSETRQY
jgi:hypothetical protein